jgi:hypothetical protein
MTFSDGSVYDGNFLDDLVCFFNNIFRFFFLCYYYYYPQNKIQFPCILFFDLFIDRHIEICIRGF